MSPEHCDEIIAIGKQRGLEPSRGFDVNTGQHTISEYRTSLQTWFRIGENALIADYERRIAEMTNLPVDNGEGFQLVHYPPGTEYKVHHDYFHKDYEGGKQVLKNGGQRLVTFMIYLNELPEGAGGETDFIYANVRIRPEKGKALIFWNVMPNWEVDESTYHAGLPPEPGHEKYILNKWIHESRFH